MRASFTEMICRVLRSTSLIYGLTLFLPLYAYNNATQIVTSAAVGSCSGSNCHGSTAPILAASSSFQVLDATTLTTVTGSYIAGKAYKLRVALAGSAARQGYAIEVTNLAGFGSTHGSLANTGGVVSSNKTARIATNAVSMSNHVFDVDWTAPAFGNIQFSVLRLEANGDGSRNGDRASQNKEIVTLTGPARPTTSPTPTPSPGSSPTPGGDSGDGSSGDGSSSGGSSGGLSAEDAAGCGVVHFNSKSPITPIFILLGVFIALIAIRRRRSNADTL